MHISKNVFQEVINSMKERKLYKAAVYLRLSKGDDDLSVLEKQESNSITNQRLLTMSYIDKHKDLKFVKEYLDDGYTGMNFNRPGLKQMMDDIDDGIIDCIVVKDLSRFGRERIEAGTYLLKTFKEKNVRFIAINDSYDSLTATNSETHVILPIKALTNDNYSRDISVKVRSSKAIKREKGDFVGGIAPYGYKKDPDNKNQLIVDEEAAEVVKRIFDKKINGKSANAIAKDLTEEGILTPSEYRRSKGEKAGGFKRTNPGKWSTRGVIRILRNEAYVGTLIQGKYRKISYKLKKCVVKPEEEWSVHANAMEPIISKIDFKTVQMLLDRDTMRGPGTDTAYLYSGMLFCGDCGCPMFRREYEGKDGKKVFYFCSRYEKGNGCSNHKIYENELNQIVTYHLTEMMNKHSNYSKVMEKLEEAEISFDEAVAHDKKIAELVKEKSSLSMLIKTLETSLVDGLVDDEQYYEYKETYLKQLDSINKAIECQKKIISSIYDEGVEAGERLDSLRDGLKVGKLTRAALVTFIERINVCKNNTLEINFRYQTMYEKLKELDRLSEQRITALRHKEA